jgi:MFS family permease
VTSSGPADDASYGRILMVSIALDCCGIVPIGIVGAFAVSIVAEMGAGKSFAGYLAGAFFLAGSVTAISVGPMIDRLGPRRAASVSSAVTALAALPVLALAERPWQMAAGCALAGSAFAITLPATNAVLGAVTPVRRKILAICTKQAAIPLALGLAAVALTGLQSFGGRRTAFGVAAAVALLALGSFRLATRRASLRSVSATTRASSHRRAQASVLRFGLATLLASLLAGVLIGFGALSLSAVGLSDASIARVLVLGNLCGITARVASGLVAQRASVQSWWPVTVLMLVGGAGTFLVASGQLVLTVVGMLLAFGFGWGWSGLTFALVLVSSPTSPGSTGALLQAGGMLGSATGPLLMALVVNHWGLGAGWVIVGSAIVVAGLVVAPVTLSPRRRRSTAL